MSREKNTQSAHKAIGTGIIVTLFTSMVLMLIFFTLKTQLLTLFGASENSIGMAIEYFNIILAFFPAFMLSNMMNAVIRADGSPSWSMASMLLGAIINIILDPVFMFGLHWGMKGAALATVMGQFLPSCLKQCRRRLLVFSERLPIYPIPRITGCLPKKPSAPFFHSLHSLES